MSIPEPISGKREGVPISLYKSELMQEGEGGVCVPFPFLWLQWGNKWTQVKFHEEDGKREWIPGKNDYFLQRD